MSKTGDRDGLALDELESVERIELFHDHERAAQAERVDQAPHAV